MLPRDYSALHSEELGDFYSTRVSGVLRHNNAKQGFDNPLSHCSLFQLELGFQEDILHQNLMI